MIDDIKDFFHPYSLPQNLGKTERLWRVSSVFTSELRNE